MTIQLSTGARDGMLGQQGLAELFTDGIIELRTGAQPANADAAAIGTLLGIVTVDALPFTPGAPTNGLQFDPPANGVIAKSAAQTWRFNGIATGAAGWYRLKGNALDDNLASTILPRLDGSVATAGSDLDMTNNVVAVGAPHTVDNFQYAMNSSNV